MITILIAVLLGIGFGRSRPLGPAMGLAAAFGFVACGAWAVLTSYFVFPDYELGDRLLGSRFAMLIGLFIGPFAAFIAHYRRRNGVEDMKEGKL